MNTKRLVFHDSARDEIRRGVDALAGAVRVTLGPRGCTVILEREFGMPQIISSGVLVAKSIELEDRCKNMGAQLLREVASRTREMAGKGTNTAPVLAHGMILEERRYLAAGMDPMDLRRGIERAIDTVAAELKTLSRPCVTSQEAAHIAAISANNDQSICESLEGAIDKVGREGAISIEDGSGLVRVLAVEEGNHWVERALEQPLRRIVSDSGDEPSVIRNQVDVSSDFAHGHNAATRTYGGFLQMGVTGPGPGDPHGVAKRGIDRQPCTHDGLHDCCSTPSGTWCWRTRHPRGNASLLMNR